MLHCCWIAAGCLRSACAPGKLAYAALGDPGGTLRACLGSHSFRGQKCASDLVLKHETSWRELKFGNFGDVELAPSSPPSTV